MARIREMKNPKILINTKHFEDFEKEIQAKVTNFKTGDNPTYEGIPIIKNDFVQPGNIFIYDDVLSTAMPPLNK